MNAADTLQIIGDMADKIKNNVSASANQFSWQLKFPKEIKTETLQTDKLMLLNKDLKRLLCDFTVSAETNTVTLSPKYPYIFGEEYYFWAKVTGKKEICVAFTVTSDNRLHAFDQKVSHEKITAASKKVSSKMKAAEAVKEARLAVRPNPEAEPAPPEAKEESKPKESKPKESKGKKK